MNNKLIKNPLPSKLLKDPTKKFLEDWNFSKKFSDSESTCYTYSFPVYTYGIHTTLECEFLLCVETKNVEINVLESGTRALYAPFYYQDYGSYDCIMHIIINNIEKEMKRLGIEYVNDNCR